MRRAYRASHLFVVALLSTVVLFTLWSEARTSGRLDTLAQQALQRAHLIGTIRVNALSLESATEARIRAGSLEEREAADAVMADILADIRRASADYTRELPARERQGWVRFNAAATALAEQVREAVSDVNLAQAERARSHLARQVRPLTAELDALAVQLAGENASEARALMREMERLRLRHTAVRVGIFLLALALSLWVGWQMTGTLERQEATIQAQLAELDRRNRELDAFASRVAHDLVTPLAPLNGYLTLLRRSPLGQEGGAREMLAALEAGVGRVGGLVEALLRFCRASSPKEGSGELDTALAVVLMELAQVAQREGVALEREVEEGLSVPCAPQLLQSLAQNLVSNAVKYTAGRPRARVRVCARREGEQALLEVEDNGRGMGPEVQARLFEPFFRAREVQALPGHGLGLATVKRLVEAHRGRLSVASTPGEGTCIRVHLPLLPAAGGQASPGVARAP